MTEAATDSANIMPPVQHKRLMLNNDSDLFLTFDIPKGDLCSPILSVIRLTWRGPFRPSADVCVELSCTTVLDINFAKCPRTCVMVTL